MTTALHLAGTGAPGALDIARTPLPPALRPRADLSVLDITEFFGGTSGGVRTYLEQKAAFVRERPTLSQVLVVPGARDVIAEGEGVRWYHLRGPRVPMRPPYRFMLATRQSRRIVEHERPDIVEVGSPGLVPWVVQFATRQTATPLVYFYHRHSPAQLTGRASPTSRWNPRALAGRLAWRYARQLDRLFERTIVASEFGARALHAAGVHRTARVPLGVDVDRFTPARRAASALTRALVGLPTEPLAMYVGRFAPEKELDVLVRAWPRVRRRTGARLVLVGDGPEEARLRALPGGDEVLWLPFEHDRDRLANLLAAADLFVAPGSIETFGLAALEAMACGIPVLASSEGGVAELVTRSGGGALFPAGSSDGLAAEAVAMLGRDGNRLHEHGMRARAYVEREHRWASVFDRLFAVYRDVLRH